MKHLLLAAVFLVYCSGRGFSANDIQIVETVSNGTTNISAMAMNDTQRPNFSQEQPGVAISLTTPSRLEPAEMLSYATVCLYFTNSNSVSSATGFYYSIPHPTQPSLHIPVIVCNKHATKDALKTKIDITLASNGSPSMNSLPLSIDNCRFAWIHHPDPSVDLSVLPIGMIWNELESHGLRPFIIPMNAGIIPPDDYMNAITQFDEVIMIGYPGGLRDEVNNQPIFRRGSLATRPSKNFGGERKYLVNMPVYPGSSGSPVLYLAKAGAFAGPPGDPGMRFDVRVKLIGINSATYTSTVTGKVIPVPVPTVVEDGPGPDIETAEGETTAPRYSLATQANVPNSIGIIIHAACLKEMEPYILTRVLGGARDEEPRQE